MPRYQVRTGAILPHEGQLLEAPAIVELPRHVGEDSIVRDLVQEVDDEGQPVVSRALADPSIEHFRSHERVSILQDRLTQAQGRVAALEQRLAAEVAEEAESVKAVGQAQPVHESRAVSRDLEE